MHTSAAIHTCQAPHSVGEACAYVATLTPAACMCTPCPRFLSFLAVHTGIVNNYALTRSIRFNAAQAVLLDILLM